jgi:hypothetical protein
MLVGSQRVLQMMDSDSGVRVLIGADHRGSHRELVAKMAEDGHLGAQAARDCGVDYWYVF